MTVPAMCSSMRVKPFALMVGIALMATPASAQVVPEPDTTEVAKTPLRDFNIASRDIPQVLRVAERNPYATAGLDRCDLMVHEIAALDQVLGADYDIAVDDGKGGLNKGRIGQSVVGSIIPFRGVVREVTGAADAERGLRAAYTAGMVRRAFLKGWGLGRGCDYPARPKPETGAGE